MTQEKVNLFIAQNSKFFPEGSLYAVRDKLLQVNDDDAAMLYSLDLKDPTTNLIVSVLVGSLGVDRFLVGDTGLGVLKLLTGGLCGIMTIVDWFLISKRTKEKNLQKFMNALTFGSSSMGF
ncbi:MAG: TM2 domain-containing protein [Clostridia bacterium]|nr:TM2 domain-containing protein [Clostridia bacterium]